MQFIFKGVYYKINRNLVNLSRYTQRIVARYKYLSYVHSEHFKNYA